MNLSVCGIDCSKCNYFMNNQCLGCRKVAPEGKCIWNGRCSLFDCSTNKKVEHCGKCSKFPCEMLKEWASGENPERIQNLIDLEK